MFFKKVSQILSVFSFNLHFSSTPFKPLQKSTKSHYTCTLKDSIFSQSSNLFPKKSHPSSFQEPLLNISHINPKFTRKFLRKSTLIPQDFLRLLLGFESCDQKSKINVKKVESLWRIFRVCNEQVGGFRHVDESFRVMLGLLVHVGLFKDAESLLLEMDENGISLENHKIFSELIKYYVEVDELEKCVSLYDRMRGRNLVPTVSCFCVLVGYLVDLGDARFVIRVFDDMLGCGVVDNVVYEDVVRGLCGARRAQEARNAIKKAFVYGIKPTNGVLDVIANAYSEKKDYDDLLSLFAETICYPDVVVGNKIVHSLCRDFGAENAFVFVEELERLGYSPNDVTFGILIGWSCRERKLRNAFVYLSNASSRGLKPHVNSYNAIISGVFKEGMWERAKDVVCEMDEKGVKPNMSTFKVLLAGYCKARRFDEVMVMINEMQRNGLIELSTLEDPVSKAFIMLGIDPLVVRLRRDNDVGLYKTEFFDSVGNGLYLEGDVVNYEKITTSVLEDSMVPDYNTRILKSYGLNSYKTAYAVVDELVQWGQELSCAAFSTLLKRFEASNSSFKSTAALLDKMPRLQNELDEETLDLLVRAYVKKGLLCKARTLYDRMVKRNFQTESKTHSVLLTGLCKKGMVTEALALFERVLVNHPHEALALYYAFLETLCISGLTRKAYVLFDELVTRGYDVDGAAFNRLLRGFCEESRFSEAFVVLNRMLDERVTPDPSLSLVVRCHFNFGTGKVEEVTRLIQETTSKGKPLTVDVYNVLVNGYCAVKDLTKLGEVLGSILRRNIRVSLSSYRNLVSLMCTEGRIRTALSINDLMLVDTSSSSLVAYNVLIFNLFLLENSVLVDTLLDEIQTKGLEFDNTTYNFLIYGFVQCKNVSRSFHYLTEMMSKGLKPSDRCVRGVIRLLCSNGELSKALNLSREMETRGYVHCSTVQNDVVEGLLNTGNLYEAVNFLDRMIETDLVPDNVNYDILIKRMCRAGRLDKAVDLLDVMLTRQKIPNSTSYDSVIQCLCSEHNIEDALDMYTEMLYRNLMPSIKTRETLIERLCGFGRTKEAEDVLRCVVSVGESPSPSEAMFVCVISRYRYERKFSKAAEVLRTMQECGYKPDFTTHWSLVSTLSESSEERDNDGREFVSRLLSESGFTKKNV